MGTESNAVPEDAVTRRKLGFGPVLKPNTPAPETTPRAGVRRMTVAYGGSAKGETEGP